MDSLSIFFCGSKSSIVSSLDVNKVKFKIRCCAIMGDKQKKYERSSSTFPLGVGSSTAMKSSWTSKSSKRTFLARS